MANKPIIEIEVDDEQFKTFVASFNEYAEKLAELPSEWQKMGAAMEGAAAVFAEASLSMVAISDSLRKAAAAQDRFADGAKKTSTHLKDTLKAVNAIGAGLAKWGGIFGATALGAGAFGIDRIAAGVYGRQRSARGLGVSIGEQQAFGLDMGRYVDSGVLSAAADAQADPSKWGLLATMGISPQEIQGMSTAQLAVRMTESARNAFRSNPSLISAQSRAEMQLGFHPDALRRLGAATDQEFNGAVARYRSDTRALGVSDPMASEWASLHQQLHRAGQEIENIFVVDLAKLAGPLGNLSAATEGAVKTLLESKVVRTGIDELAVGVKDFASFLTSPSFQADVKTFTDDIGTLARKVFAALQLFSPAPSSGGSSSIYPPDSDAKVNPVSQKGIAYRLSHPDEVLNPTYDFSDPEKKYGLKAGTLAALAQVESSMNPFARSKKGASGMFGIMPDTAKSLGINPYAVDQAAYGAGWLVRWGLDHYRGDIRKAIAAYNWSPDKLDKDIARNGIQWFTHMPKETQGEVIKWLKQMAKNGQRQGQPKVVIENNTSSSVATSARAVGYQ